MRREYDYKQGLKPWIRWMPRPMLIVVVLLFFPIALVLGCLIGACMGMKEAIEDEWRTLMRIVRKGR